MRWGWSLVALTLSACIYTLPPSGAAEVEVQASPEPSCREVPRYESRVVALEGEWTQPAPPSAGWEQIQVCRAESPDAPATCDLMSQREYELSRTAQVQVGTDRVCEAEPAPVYAPGTYAPSTAPVPGGPVHVRGYYRRDGTYVRPHTRARPRR